MRQTTLAWLGLTAITIVLSGCSKDTATPTSSDEPGARPGAVGSGGAGASIASDDEFVADVAMKNMAEIALSRMALDNSTNPDIKRFAQRLIDDHSAAGIKLKSVSSGTPVEWPAQLDEKHRKTADRLAAIHGPEFDRDYLQAMIEGHQDLAAKLESRIDVQSLADWKTAAAARTQSKAMPEPTTAMRDTAVRPDRSGNESTMKINQWAADMYPVAQKHLDTARTLENAAKR
jgi:putative membrane protein